MKKELLTLALALLTVCGVSAAVQTANSLSVKSSKISPPPVNEHLTDKQVPTLLQTAKTTPAPQTRADEDGWTSLGMATYREDILTTFFNLDNVSYQVEIQENNATPGYYRLVNPYGAAYPENEPGDWDDSQDWYLEIHAEDPTAVYIETQQTGLDWGYGNTIISSMAGYYIEDGSATVEEMKAEGYTGTLVDGIITFPTRALLICLPNYSTSFYYSNLNGMFAVALPDVVLDDYSLKVEYGGSTTDNEAVNIELSMGTHLTSVELAVVSGREANTALAQIINGEISTTTATTSGTIAVPFSVLPAISDYYTVVAVGYAGTDVMSTAAATFEYASTTETWTAKYLGIYSYDLNVFEGEEELTLYQSNENANRWKLENWGFGVDFNFTWNQKTNEVLVADQPLGYTHTQYGEVYVTDLVEYFGDASEGDSYYADGVFHFAIAYNVSAGYFGYGEETFTITEGLAAALNTATAGTWSVSGADRTLRIAGTDVEAAVYDITGHLVYRGTDRAINVPAAGVYMVRIGGETKRAIVK